MEKINNWNEVEAKGMEDFKALPIGAYECIIKEAGVHKNEQSGKKTFRVAVDIASGEFKNYYQQRYDSNTSMDKKWDNNAVRYLAFEGDNVAYFKGFITAVENSNPGYKWNWEEETLVNKKIGGIFLYEEYENQEGKRNVKVRLNKFRSLDKLKDAFVSDSVKMLDGSYLSIVDYKATRDASQKTEDKEEDYIEITDDFLD